MEAHPAPWRGAVLDVRTPVGREVSGHVSGCRREVLLLRVHLWRAGQPDGPVAEERDFSAGGRRRRGLVRPQREAALRAMRWPGLHRRDPDRATEAGCDVLRA